MSSKCYGVDGATENYSVIGNGQNIIYTQPVSLVMECPEDAASNKTISAESRQTTLNGHYSCGINFCRDEVCYSDTGCSYPDPAVAFKEFLN